MELLTGTGTDGAIDARSATELNDSGAVLLGLRIGFAAELVDARQLGVEAAARVVACGCDLCERHDAAVECELEERPAWHAQAGAAQDDREAFSPAAGRLVTPNRRARSRAPEARRLRRVLHLEKRRRLVRHTTPELPNVTHAVSYTRV